MFCNFDATDTLQKEANSDFHFEKVIRKKYLIKIARLVLMQHPARVSLSTSVPASNPPRPGTAPPFHLAQPFKKMQVPLDREHIGS